MLVNTLRVFLFQTASIFYFSDKTTSQMVLFLVLSQPPCSLVFLKLQRFTSSNILKLARDFNFKLEIATPVLLPSSGGRWKYKIVCILVWTQIITKVWMNE